MKLVANNFLSSFFSFYGILIWLIITPTKISNIPIKTSIINEDLFTLLRLLSARVV